MSDFFVIQEELQSFESFPIQGRFSKNTLQSASPVFLKKRDSYGLSDCDVISPPQSKNYLLSEASPQASPRNEPFTKPNNAKKSPLNRVSDNMKKTPIQKKLSFDKTEIRINQKFNKIARVYNFFNEDSQTAILSSKYKFPKLAKISIENSIKQQREEPAKSPLSPTLEICWEKPAKKNLNPVRAAQIKKASNVYLPKMPEKSEEKYKVEDEARKIAQRIRKKESNGLTPSPRHSKMHQSNQLIKRKYKFDLPVLEESRMTQKNAYSIEFDDANFSQMKLSDRNIPSSKVLNCGTLDLQNSPHKNVETEPSQRPKRQIATAGNLDYYDWKRSYTPSTKLFASEEKLKFEIENTTFTSKNSPSQALTPRRVVLTKKKDKEKKEKGKVQEKTSFTELHNAHSLSNARILKKQVSGNQTESLVEHSLQRLDTDSSVKNDLEQFRAWNSRVLTANSPKANAKPIAPKLTSEQRYENLMKNHIEDRFQQMIRSIKMKQKKSLAKSKDKSSGKKVRFTEVVVI